MPGPPDAPDAPNTPDPPGNGQRGAISRRLRDLPRLDPERPQEPAQHQARVGGVGAGPAQIDIELAVGEVAADPVRQAHRQRGLADPAHPGDHRQAPGGQGFADPRGPALAPDEGRGVRRQLSGDGKRPQRCVAHIAVLGQDLGVRLAHLGARFHTELVDHLLPQRLVEPQRLGRPAVGGQQPHPRGLDRFVQRGVPSQRVQVRQSSLRAAVLERRPGPGQHRGANVLLDGAQQRIGVAHPHRVGEHRPAPERDRGGEVPALHRPAEAAEVDRLGTQAQPVAAAVGVQDEIGVVERAQPAAQTGDRRLQRAESDLLGLVVPDQVQQAAGAEPLSFGQQQDPEQALEHRGSRKTFGDPAGLLLRAAFGLDPQWSEHAEGHPHNRGLSQPGVRAYEKGGLPP